MAGIILGNALPHAVKPKLIPFNPAADIAKPRLEDKEMLYFTDTQARLFLAAARGDRYFALFALALGSRMRQGELLGLQWSDINLDKATVNVCRSLMNLKGTRALRDPKTTRSRRTISLPCFAVEALIEHRAAMLAEGHIAAPVFCTRAGTFLRPARLTGSHFHPIIKRANRRAVELADQTGVEPLVIPEIRFPDLRHTHATSLLAQGHNVKAVSLRLGHASIKVTLEIYAHVLPTDDKALAEGLDRLFG
jgi:integrase